MKNGECALSQTCLHIPAFISDFVFFIFHLSSPIFSFMNDIIEKFLKKTVWLWLPFVALVKLSKAAIAKMFPKEG